MAKPRGATSYRLSSDAKQILAALAEQLGVSKTSVLEMAIRKLGRSELPDTFEPQAGQVETRKPTIVSSLTQQLQN
jgi:hypothetical protein